MNQKLSYKSQNFESTSKENTPILEINNFLNKTPIVWKVIIRVTNSMPAIHSGKDDYQTYTNNNFLNRTPIVWKVIARISKSMPAINS